MHMLYTRAFLDRYREFTHGVSRHSVRDDKNPATAMPALPCARVCRGDTAYCYTSGPSVYVRNTGHAEAICGVGVWGWKLGGSGVGTKGYSLGSTGSGVSGDSVNYVGTWGQSDNDRGMYARTNWSDSNYGVYTPDNLWSLNYHLAGAVMQLVQNSGGEALEAGDVVVFSGVAAPFEEGGPPVVQVAKAVSANSPAVAGVVFSRYNVERLVGEPEQAEGRVGTPGLDVTPAGPAEPGEYLLVVVQGPALVKASAVAGAIPVGAPLSGAAGAGHGALATGAAPGVVFGKALQPLDADLGLIYVFVSLQ
jgi:hypothetical protein